ncbi:MAG: glycine cleavage system protein H [Bacteroidales bacterium]
MKILDAFTYTDIFDTKGIEYLVIVGFLLLLIPTWILLTRPVSMKLQLVRSINGLSAALLKIPRGLFYNRNHTWTYLERSGEARVGVDDLLLHITGGVSVDFLRSEGEKINQGELIARFSRDNKKLDIASPISGKIQKFNASIAEKEGLINMDPYGKGWICKVKPDNWKKETLNSKIDEEAVEWSKEELSRCKDFLATVAGQTGTVLQEGGELTDFPLAELPGEIWNKFQSEFLD